MRRVAATRITTAAAAVAAAAAFTACAGAPYPADAAAYLPAQLAGRDVVVDDPRAVQLASSLEGDGVESVRAAAVVGVADGDAADVPPVVAVATVDGPGPATIDAALFRPVDDVRDVRVGGVTMRTARSRQAGREVEFTVWRPTSDIVVVAAGVDGGRRGARDAMAALVAATRPGGGE